MDLKTVLYEKKDRMAFITLNRPERLNAFNTLMCDELERVWLDIKKDNDIWVVIVTGAGEKSFCTGVDVKEWDSTGEISISRKTGGEYAPLLITALHNKVWKPVITAVNGICCGGGLHFVCDTDICICSENATFFDTHVNVGGVASWEPIGLTRKIPLEVVMRMFLMGRSEVLDAKRALQVSMVSEVVPQQGLMPRAIKIAETILENAPLAVWGTKKATWRGLDFGLEHALEYGLTVLQDNMKNEDFKEGARAYVEKRKPNWKAR